MKFVFSGLVSSDLRCELCWRCVEAQVFDHRFQHRRQGSEQQVARHLVVDLVVATSSVGNVGEPNESNGRGAIRGFHAACHCKSRAQGKHNTTEDDYPGTSNYL